MAKIHFDDPVVCGTQKPVEYTTSETAVTCKNCLRILGY